MSKDIIDKLKDVPYCDEQESKEITKILDNLTEEDLEIVEEHKLIDIRQIRPIVLNREETVHLMQILMKDRSMPDEFTDCLHESICQTDYDINILCRLTKDSYEETVKQLKGE